MYEYEHDRLCDDILADTDLIGEALTVLGPDRAVPSCPGWTTGRMLIHLHQALSWGATIVEKRATEFLPPSATEEPGEEHAETPGEAHARTHGETHGETHGDWTRRVDSLAHQVSDSDGSLGRDTASQVSWLRAAAERMVTALREAGPHATVWTTFGAQEARFWSSWAAAEVAVHRADLDLVRGRRVRIDTGTALDAVDLWLHAIAAPSAAMFFDPRLAEMRGRGETFGFRAVDAPDPARGLWRVTRTPEGLLTERPAPDRWASDTSPSVTVHGTADELLLLLKRRTRVESSPVTVSGESQLLDHWLDHVLT
ncbi:maleylpyruvate isomerase N-terminal domain-containing protein [Streptomyces sp. P38-E01]|uniref:Maleylpyruvate isomerase N-terminal domain-containing protein n=1 Tax=Streptomyces tardus TaxID=2780544 RepID=A0A949JPE2_9ACTN|nr:maleylpyruvate isomerase N-terminal domain-containing protein [Streptomyces tardus]MBU7597835.1 maleylpyruvate isomerase N-terminal domain-containing protein [Streptomyces tardus]